MRSTCPSGVGAMTWSPLACGLLTGKYNEGVPESSRAAMKVLTHTHTHRGMLAMLYKGHSLT